MLYFMITHTGDHWFNCPFVQRVEILWAGGNKAWSVTHSWVRWVRSTFQRNKEKAAHLLLRRSRAAWELRGNSCCSVHGAHFVLAGLLVQTVHGAWAWLVLQWLGRVTGPRSISISVWRNPPAFLHQTCDVLRKNLNDLLGGNHWTNFHHCNALISHFEVCRADGRVCEHLLVPGCPAQLLASALAAALAWGVWDVSCFLKVLHEYSLCARCWKMPSIASDLAGFHCSRVNKKSLPQVFYTAGLILAVVPC